MALIACPECEATISDKAPACPRCGAPAASESKLIVSVPMQAFLFTPKVYIRIGASEEVVLQQGELVTFPIERDCKVEFNSLWRSASISVRAGEVTRVQVAWNRLSGALVAQRVEAFTSGSAIV